MPTGSIERVRAPAASAELLGRNVILDLKPFETRESSGRGPTRIFASDGDGNSISLIYFNNPGWAKRSLPIGQVRTVSGKLEAYGDEWQIIHPEVSEPEKTLQVQLRERPTKDFQATLGFSLADGPRVGFPTFWGRSRAHS